MKWPTVKIVSTKTHTEYKFVGGGWVPLLMACTMSTSMFLPYFITIARGTLEPFLPFVSQAAGSPPQSGVFTVFIAFSCLLAFIGLHALHMAVKTQLKKLDNPEVRRLVSILNRLSLVPAHCGILGMIIVAGYPMDFHRSSERWMSVTLVPHMIGALSIFFGGIGFCILITYALALLHPEKKKLLGTRVLLICFIVTLAALQGYTVQEGFRPELEDTERLTTCITEKLEYNLSYLVSAMSEWMLLIAFVIFFVSLREEANYICFSIGVTIKEPCDVSEIKKADENQNVNESTQALKEDS